MPKIEILPEEIRSKIAAGEVVERPASVVKELVENSFDACASTVKVSIKEGGIKEVAVYDDGEGIEPEDLRLCYKHHATSKVKSLSDIFRIVTFGFRGEALASIAQVSRLTIKSRHQGFEDAYEVFVEFGKEVSFKPTRLNKGTLVVVRDLFANLPARKAFLKSPRAETIKIMEVIKGLSLCHPEVRYQVKTLSEKGDRELFFWEGGPLKELLSYILGIKSEYFKEVYLEKPPYSVELVLTDTSKTFPHTKYLYTLVNKRLVKDEKLIRLVLNALKPFYGNLGFPAGLVSIKAPYHLVDINVHPAKWEVRFKDERALFSAISGAFEELFKSKKRIYSLPESRFYFQKEEVKEDLPVEYTAPKKVVPVKKLFSEEQKRYRYLGSFLNTYLLVELEKDLLVVDQHALCERVIFEELKEKYESSVLQELLIPVLIRISDSAVLYLEEKLNSLRDLGFEINLIGGRELILKRMPAIFKEDVKDVLEEVLEGAFSEVNRVKEEVLAGYACKQARKKGDRLSEEEARYLIEKMLKMGLKTCPHGRPLYFKLSLPEIENRLRRRV